MLLRNRNAQDDNIHDVHVTLLRIKLNVLNEFLFAESVWHIMGNEN